MRHADQAVCPRAQAGDRAERQATVHPALAEAIAALDDRGDWGSAFDTRWHLVAETSERAAHNSNVYGPFLALIIRREAITLVTCSRRRSTSSTTRAPRTTPKWTPSAASSSRRSAACTCWNLPTGVHPGSEGEAVARRRAVGRARLGALRRRRAARGGSRGSHEAARSGAGQARVTSAGRRAARRGAVHSRPFGEAMPGCDRDAQVRSLRRAVRAAARPRPQAVGVPCVESPWV